MIVWVKQSGSEIETNDRKETIAYAESIGWKRKDADKPKRGRKPKVTSDDNS